MTTPAAAPIRYDGRDHAAAKHFVAGAHRAMPPEETLERVRPHLAKGGITRIADVTGLDTIGLPVAVATRPASGTLAVEGGKGATFAAAMASAAMEAIERFVAETFPIEKVWATTGEMADRLPCAVQEFPVSRHTSIATDRRYAWSMMRDLHDDAEWWVPSDLVVLPTGVMVPNLSHPWAAGSNGLASGNDLLEALCAGLYEVIERDATTCWRSAGSRGDVPLLVVDQDSLSGPVLPGLLDVLDRAGADAVIAWCPTDIGVPVAMAYVVDRERGIGLYQGYGCHLDPEIAVIRAVTEAVQSRTIIVSGARDDQLRPVYEAMKRSDVYAAAAVVDRQELVSLSDIPSLATPTFEGDVRVVLDRLARAGFHRVLARELDASQFEASVARVLVPGLAPHDFAWVDVGERARTFDAWAYVP
jgi:ribosomal protein S12 methylthiotransferase accessory factor